MFTISKVILATGPRSKATRNLGEATSVAGETLFLHQGNIQFSTLLRFAPAAGLMF